MLKDLANDLVLAGFYEGDDFHGPAALGAQQRIGLVDALDEHGPAAAVEPCGGDDGRP